MFPTITNTEFSNNVEKDIKKIFIWTDAAIKKHLVLSLNSFIGKAGTSYYEIPIDFIKFWIRWKEKIGLNKLPICMFVIINDIFHKHTF